MQRNDQTPTYNLKVVVRETGLKHDTLRAWERRYGLPQPQRTQGGHRLYSQRDIDTLKWLMARQKEGLSISRAVDLWHQLEADGQDPLLSMVPTEDTIPVSPVVGSLAAGQTLITLQEQWVQACLRFNEFQAERLSIQAMALFSPETVCLEFLQKGLQTIGQLWARGEATVQQEHFASTMAIRRLDNLLAAAPPPSRTGRILVSCPAEEVHTFSLLLATYLLRRSGWDTVFLGANVPLTHLQETVATIRPNLVILAAQQFFTAASLLETALVLQNEQVTIAYGGLIFNLMPELQQLIPGYFLGDSVQKIPQAVESFITRPVTSPTVAPPTPAFAQTRNYFNSRQNLIETRLWEQFGDDIPPRILTSWNLNTGRNLQAALTFGDMALLSRNVLWDRDWWINTPLNKNTLHRYLTAYSQAAQAVLGQQGQSLLAGLAYLPV